MKNVYRTINTHIGQFFFFSFFFSSLCCLLLFWQELSSKEDESTTNAIVFLIGDKFDTYFVDNPRHLEITCLGY